MLADGRSLRIAGISVPEERRLDCERFLRLVTRQGVEVIRELPGGQGHVLRCEPRVRHTCGNDRVLAHYEQFVLNELLVASGHADHDPSAGGLTKDERRRLEACSLFARDEWSARLSEFPNAGALAPLWSSDDHSIRLGDVLHFQRAFEEFYALVGPGSAAAPAPAAPR